MDNVRRLIVMIIVLFLNMFLSSQLLYTQSDLSDDLRKIIEVRKQQLTTFYPEPVRRSAVNNIVIGSLISEKAIANAAKEQNIAVTDDEIANFLVPLLARQGLIDVTKR
jgi:SurA N-terminal domain